MNMQYALEAEAESTGIVYPRASFHKKKDGRNKTSICDPCSQITEAIEKGTVRLQRQLKREGQKYEIEFINCQTKQSDYRGN